MHTYSKHSLMPRFFLADAGGAPIWNPDYLASEPDLVTEPKQVVTYNINPKAIWYDGTPMTWEDFSLAVAGAATARIRRIRLRRPPATRTSKMWRAAATTAKWS